MGGVFEKIGELLREKIEGESGESREWERGRVESVETVRGEPTEQELGKRTVRGEPTEEILGKLTVRGELEPCVGEVVHHGEYFEDVPVKIVTDEVSRL